jgi:hypothetical protein
MTHLSESELLDAAEARLSAERQRHAETCAACARQIEDLRDVLARTIGTDVPEPSPLFWDHFSARVRDEIANETPGRWGWTSGLRAWPVAAAAAVVVALLVAISVFRAPSNQPTAGTDRQEVADARPPAVAPVDADADADSDPNDVDVEVDEAWAVVRAVADDVVWDDVTNAGISARPGSADRAIQTLSAAERTELAALIAEELKRSGA